MTGLVALTRGDPSGIGLEIALKAWSTRDAATPAFLLIADLAHSREAAKALRLDVPMEPATPDTAAAVFSRALPVLPLGGSTRGLPGRPDAADACGTIAAMERAVELAHRGDVAAVTTLPVCKEILHRVGYPHPGQTEFMGELARRFWGVTSRPVMLLWSPTLAVVPATIHVPLASVPRLVTADLVEETIRAVDADMRRRFGMSRPRIAVAGLNPHAGEGGDIGREEQDLLVPLLARLQGEGLRVTGPHPADTLFHAAARERYDVCVTMYHDQALIPIKTLAFDSAVNVTLGLPFVRTSPDHGTAFDIAGKGVADPSSLIAALRLADRLAAADRMRDAA